MRALVLGSGGQLVTEIVSELRRKGMSVVGLGRDELDITDEIMNLIDEKIKTIN